MVSLLLGGCAAPGAPLPVLSATRAPVVEHAHDVDGDGYDNDRDGCPRVPGIAPDGCPETNREIPADLAAITGNVYKIRFQATRQALEPGVQAFLDRVVAVLGKYPAVRIEVAGHTVYTGHVYGREPSMERALAVKGYLVEHGVAADRVDARGAGPDEPIVSNKTAAGRAKNRRIEISISCGWRMCQ